MAVGLRSTKNTFELNRNVSVYTVIYTVLQVPYLARGRFNTWTGEVGDRTTNPATDGRPLSRSKETHVISHTCDFCNDKRQNVSDKPCGISPSVYVCPDPVPEIRPSSRAALLGTRSWTAPFDSPSATCLRWLDSEMFRPPGASGTEGSSEPVCRTQC